MVATDQRVPVDLDLGAVPEFRRGRGTARSRAASTRSVASQANDPSATITRSDSSRPISRTRYGRQLSRSRSRLVGRRSAPHRGRDVAPAQTQPVVARHRCRLVGEAGPVERPEQPVARAVAREDPPRAVSPMGRRRKPDHEHSGLGIAEARERLAPVLLGRERRPLDARHLLTPGDQPRAAPAGDDLPLELAEVRLIQALRARP